MGAVTITESTRIARPMSWAALQATTARGLASSGPGLGNVSNVSLGGTVQAGEVLIISERMRRPSSHVLQESGYESSERQSAMHALLGSTRRWLAHIILQIANPAPRANTCLVQEPLFAPTVIEGSTAQVQDKWQVLLVKGALWALMWRALGLLLVCHAPKELT